MCLALATQPTERNPAQFYLHRKPNPFRSRANDSLFAFKVLAPPSHTQPRCCSDSLTAGFGSRGVNPPCEVTQYSSSNYYSYSRYVCSALDANCSVIAWSGKGMWENCCNDHGETMPAYFLQTLGSESFSTDWDFSFVPDALAINLGSNDRGNYNGTAQWVQEFVSVYTAFVLDAVNNRYKLPHLPVLVVQGPFNDSLLFGAMNTIVSELNSAGANASYVSAIVNATMDGCSGHPGVGAHAAMADTLLPQIRDIMGW